MRARQAGILLGVIHMALVGSVGLKLLIDRARLPRGWARTAPYDPSLPIRGRYVSLRLEVPLTGVSDTSVRDVEQGVTLAIVDQRLAGTIDGSDPERTVTVRSRDGAAVGVLRAPVAYFIPEHIADPSIRPPGEQLWAEVTVPKRGPARPIQLGIYKEGVLTPLPIR
jgi:hypothetical protein